MHVVWHGLGTLGRRSVIVFSAIVISLLVLGKKMCGIIRSSNECVCDGVQTSV